MTRKSEEKHIYEIRKYLESYATNKKMLSMMKYEKEYFAKEDTASSSLFISFGDEVFIRSKMYDVRKFIMNLDDGDAKLLLFYHYIRGFSIEKCSELMDIGRTSAFRLRHRALEYASKKYKERANEYYRLKKELSA